MQFRCFDVREAPAQRLIEQLRRRVGMARTSVAHEHYPHPRVVSRNRLQKLHGRLASEVTIVKMVAMPSG